MGWRAGAFLHGWLERFASRQGSSYMVVWLALVGSGLLPDAWPGVRLPRWLTFVLWFCLGALHLGGPSYMVGCSGAWRRFPLPLVFWFCLECMHGSGRWLLVALLELPHPDMLLAKIDVYRF